MRFMKSLAIALVASFASLVAVPAFAETPATAKAAPAADAGKHAKKFPMAGAEFKSKVDQRVAKARQHMETRIGSLPADKQKEARDKFNAGVSAVNAEVQRAVADNVVTKDEAKKVHETSRALGGGGHGHGHGHKKAAKK